jgi:hypothetical protein
MIRSSSDKLFLKLLQLRPFSGLNPYQSMMTNKRLFLGGINLEQPNTLPFDTASWKVYVERIGKETAKGGGCAGARGNVECVQALPYGAERDARKDSRGCIDSAAGNGDLILRERNSNSQQCRDREHINDDR